MFLTINAMHPTCACLSHYCVCFFIVMQGTSKI